MNTSSLNRYTRFTATVVLAAAAVFLIPGCATTPQSPPGAADVRSKLSALQSNVRLADQVPVEIRAAEAAVSAAEEPVGDDVALGEHRIYIADRKVELAMARASTRLAEDQRADLSQARDDARLNARTREVDSARRQTETAQRAADTARAAAEVAANEAAKAADEAEELRRQIGMLEAEATERGLVLTLGDVLFDTGRSDLKSGGTNTLDKLTVFLNQYPDRTVAIEGHTDDVGSLDMNQTLSEHRADSVKSYLVQKGIQSQRLDASGMGETRPIAENSSDMGRQQNRRVEVIIRNPSIASATTTN